MASSLLTRWGRAEKEARTAAVVPAGSARDVRQVAANGTVYAGAALAATLTGDARWGLAALGAIAAAAADTWATEVGTRWGGIPRSVLSGARLAPGESGGVTPAGIAASVVAASLVGAAGPWTLGPVPVEALPLATVIAIAGLAGSLVDSGLGAALQAKRWCARCGAWTEREVHPCGATTRHARGLRWMTNDTVNLLSTVAGAGVALALAGPLD